MHRRGHPLFWCIRLRTTSWLALVLLRVQILESEGDRQAKINVAEAKKAEVILASEASKLDQINRAEGKWVWASFGGGYGYLSWLTRLWPTPQAGRV